MRTTLTADQKKTSQEHWARALGDDEAEQAYLSATLWCDLFVLREYVWPQLGGRDWFEWLRPFCTPPRARGVSFCSGRGAVERDFRTRGLMETCVGYDLSPELVRLAHQQAHHAGITGVSYVESDCDSLELAPASIDLALGWMGLHHVNELERLYDQVASALEPGGIFVINEYVGPSRAAYPPEQLALASEWLSRLPEALRQEVTGVTRSHAEIPCLDGDPSEAIRSAEILPLLEERFDYLARVDYGGGLLQPVLDGLMHNFDEGTPAHCDWLRALFRAERDAMAEGLPNHFTYAVVRPKEAPRG